MKELVISNLIKELLMLEQVSILVALIGPGVIFFGLFIVISTQKKRPRRRY